MHNNTSIFTVAVFSLIIGQRLSCISEKLNGTRVCGRSSCFHSYAGGHGRGVSAGHGNIEGKDVPHSLLLLLLYMLGVKRLTSTRWAWHRGRREVVSEVRGGRVNLKRATQREGGGERGEREREEEGERETERRESHHTIQQGFSLLHVPVLV